VRDLDADVYDVIVETLIEQRVIRRATDGDNPGEEPDD